VPENGHIACAGLESWLDGDNTLDPPAGNPSSARLGASAAARRGRFRLALPLGFLARWHEAEIPERRWRQDAPSQALLARLERALSAGGSEDRLAAAEALRTFGQHAAPALSAVMVAVRDELPAVRWRAVEILRLLVPPEHSFPVLAEALRSDPCRSVRWRAAEALGARTLPAEPSARALIEASQDDDEWVRWHSNRVLTQVVEPSLLHSLLPGYAASSPLPAIRAYAIGLLARGDHVDEALLLRLVEGLRHPAVVVRLNTIDLVTRHLPRADKRVRHGLRLCLEDAQPTVRVRAVRAIGRVGGRSAATLIQSAFADQDPAVRAMVCEALADAEDGGWARRRWLRHALGDSRLGVRLAGARALMRLGLIDGEIVTVLASALERPFPSLAAWRALVALEAPYHRTVLAAVSALRPSTLLRLVAEDAAAGRLPTIGLRLWPERARIRFPNKEGGDRPPLALGYPWANVGVFHSWESHLEPLRAIRSITKQICLGAPPYPYAHLVAAMELARHLPTHLDGKSAPVHLEGWPVGSVLEGTIGVEPGRVGRPRLDFVFGVDLRFCQYATFAALCSEKNGPLQELAANQWKVFVSRMLEVLDSHGLAEFSRTHWFDPEGWQSSRYGVRHERPYPEIRGGVTSFLRALRSSRGKRLANDLLGAADELVRLLECEVWRDTLRSYPQAVRQHLASGILAKRLGAFRMGESQDDF
jgi:HEAT repeat protein